jgi:hypothetical protein
MALIQIKYRWDPSQEDTKERLKLMYEEQVAIVRKLLDNKNHDYGEAWRMMRLSSIIDIILMKVYRTKRIEDNAGKTLISEGIDANYQDMINYSIFGLIKLSEIKE